jgi:hypothetical protein
MGAPVLAHVDVIHERQVEAEQPPAVGQAQRKVGLLLRQQPASQPAAVVDEALEGLQAVDPVVIARDRKRRGAVVPPQRLRCRARPADRPRQGSNGVFTYVKLGPVFDIIPPQRDTFCMQAAPRDFIMMMIDVQGALRCPYSKMLLPSL